MEKALFSISLASDTHQLERHQEMKNTFARVTAFLKTPERRMGGKDLAELVERGANFLAKKTRTFRQ